MRRFSAVLLTILSLAASTAPEAGAGDDGGQTLYGLYTSGFSSGVQRLRAEFAPTDDGHWNVEFHFRWAGNDRIYAGVAWGSLSEGLLHGRVQSEDRTRTFTFRCEFDQKNRCRGKHAEVVRTGEHETGTITLKGPR